jgi:4-diphosphocytidyl-2-C-methyl-D-erythritol kinase
MTETLDEWPAPAKINLFLHVVGRRADGYHLLQSVFRFLDYGDFLRFNLRKDSRVRRLNFVAGVPEEKDLIVRAARRLQSHTGCRLGADIELEKRLPLGAGLGGGSSDAATTLIALNRIWRLGLPRGELQTMGLTLGADVPVFLFGKSAFADGVGEQLQAVSIPPAWYVVLNPGPHVSTAEVFRHPALTRNTSAIKIRDFSSAVTLNNLEPVVRSLYPEVGRCLDWLGRFGEARMTGSGACVFASFPMRDSADEVLRQVPAEWRGFVAAGLDEHPLLGQI